MDLNFLVCNEGASRSGIPVELHNKYRDLLFSKRDLKRKLKKFDEDFLEKYGRNPKKSDKEVSKFVPGTVLLS